MNSLTIPILVALFILYIVNQGVTRHLERMAAYARDLSLERLGREPLQLDRSARQADHGGAQQAPLIDDFAHFLQPPWAD